MRSQKTRREQTRDLSGTGRAETLTQKARSKAQSCRFSAVRGGFCLSRLFAIVDPVLTLYIYCAETTLNKEEGKKSSLISHVLSGEKIIEVASFVGQYFCFLEKNCLYCLPQLNHNLIYKNREFVAIRAHCNFRAHYNFNDTRSMGVSIVNLVGIWKCDDCTNMMKMLVFPLAKSPSETPKGYSLVY